jgi:phage tail sheath protein FI
MPEYLAPGVYVEEVSFRAKSIEGVGTTTTGFIGPTRFGPTDLTPEVITSIGEFEATYGDGQPLEFSDVGKMTNFSWQAVRAFFEEGGTRLYFVRTFLAGSADDGHASFDLATGTANEVIRVRARFPGAAGNVRVRFTLRIGPNVLGGSRGSPTVGALEDGDVVRIDDLGSPLASPLGSRFYVAEEYTDATTHRQTFRFRPGSGAPVELSDLLPDPNPAASDQIRIVTLAVTVYPQDPARLPQVWNDLPIDPRHLAYGAPDSFVAFFGTPPTDLAQEATLPIGITIGSAIHTGLDVLRALEAAAVAAGNPAGILAAAANDAATDDDRSVTVRLDGGNDGVRPTATEYEGTASDTSTVRTGLKALESIEDIAIVAAPGSTFRYEHEYRDNAATIFGLLIAHAQRMKYRIAVLDSGENQTIAQVRAMRGRLDSTYAAMYYPWITVLDPITRREIELPPSGFITGIYARNDINRAVWKAPANEVINLALDFEHRLNKAQQDVLNPEGVNCLRFFEGRGFRVWGARTISSDPEWKYLNLRRYFAYLEHSIDRGTQWAVFEPNGDALWTNIRLTISDFLFNEWVSGALLGDKPEKAYFVRCDRSTMTQADIDNGRMICLIGVAVVKPAEYVIFRIGQWTANART